MKVYTKANASEGECELYRLLSSLAPIYNPQFSHLVLPAALEIGSDTLALPYYEGATFNETWSEATGGSDISLEFANDIVNVINELSLITLANIPFTLQQNQRFVYDFETDCNSCKAIINALHERKAITNAECLLLRESLDIKRESSLTFNNGDFYPRNFIQQENKLVIIDWEMHNPNSPFFNWDHISNVAAVMYVHMWKNKPWQERYTTLLNNAFTFTIEEWKAAVVSKSLRLIWLWLEERPDLVDEQLNLIWETLQ